MTTSFLSEYVVTDDELHAAACRVGVHGFPTVLAMRPRHDKLDALNAARDRATEALSARGLIVEGAVDAELADVLQPLHRPARELTMRWVTPDGVARICVVRRGTTSVLARRIGDDIMLRRLDQRGELGDAVQALAAELPRANPAQVDAVGAPTDVMAEALSDSHDPAALADRIRALGAQPRAAMLLGAALGSREAFAEIVYHALIEGEDRVSRARAAVGIFYTKRGRIVAAPSVSPSGQLWTTLKAGSVHAFRQAIDQLVELSGEKWGDS